MPAGGASPCLFLNKWYCFGMKTISKSNVLAFAFVLSAFFATSASADNGIYKIDFGVNYGGATSTNLVGWNNFQLGDNPSTVRPLVDSLGASTTLNYMFTVPIGCGTGGNGGTSASYLYPSSATIDYIYGGAGCGPDTSTMFITGLNPSYTYNVKAFSSRFAGYGSRKLRLSVGNASSTVEAVDNTSNLAVLNNIAPNASGTMFVNFSQGTPNNYFYLNVLEINANTPNIPPQVNAGTDATVYSYVPSVALNGTATDTDGTLAYKSWSLFSGDASAVIANASSSNATVSNLYPGKYVFRLTAIDNMGITVSDDVVVNVLPADFVGNHASKKIVILGSSTSAGWGSTPDGTFDNSWVKLFEKYMKLYNANSSVVNLGVPGYTTNKALPTGSNQGEDTTKNITTALAQNPDAIIVNFTTNDASQNYSVASSTAYIRAITQAAKNANIPIWVTTSIGRNLDVARRNLLIGYRDAIVSEYGDKALDIWSPVANANGTTNALYDSGDGIHLNNKGHSVLYRKMVESNIMPTVYGTLSAEFGDIACTDGIDNDENTLIDAADPSCSVTYTASKNPALPIQSPISTSLLPVVLRAVTTAPAVNANAPVAPTDITALASGANALIIFKEPKQNTKSPTTYTVTSYPGGITTSSKNQLIQVKGLKSGVSYTFTIKAENKFGTSSESKATTPIVFKGR